MTESQRLVPVYWQEAKRFLTEEDPVLGALIRAREEPPLRSRGDLFETLAHAIVGQQISVAAAAAIWRRLSEQLGAISPNQVLAASAQQLREVGLSGRKVEYLRGLAAEGNWIVSHPWQEESDDAVRKQLCQLRGVGPWTAEMVLIFSLLRPDVLPLGDLGLVRAIERLYADGARLSGAEIEEIGQRWRPYRTVATWYLWRSIDPEPILY